MTRNVGAISICGFFSFSSPSLLCDSSLHFHDEFEVNGVWIVVVDVMKVV